MGFWRSLDPQEKTSMPFSEQHIHDVANAIDHSFNEEELSYVRYHAKRFAFVLNLVAPRIEPTSWWCPRTWSPGTFRLT